MLIKKKKTYYLEEFSVLVEDRVKIKEMEKLHKFLDPVREVFHAWKVILRNWKLEELS